MRYLDIFERGEMFHKLRRRTRFHIGIMVGAVLALLFTQAGLKLLPTLVMYKEDIVALLMVFPVMLVLAFVPLMVRRHRIIADLKKSL